MGYDLEKRRLEKTSGWLAQSVTCLPLDVTVNFLPAAHTVIHRFRVDLRTDFSGRAV
jgi:hypothetical protein